jgi:two-component system nitrogen regulation response regulator NtrX
MASKPADASSHLAILMGLRDALKDIQDPATLLDTALRFLVEHLNLSFGMGELPERSDGRIGPYPRAAKIPEETKSLLSNVRRTLHGEFSWSARSGSNRLQEFSVALPMTGLGPSVLGFVVLGGEESREEGSSPQEPPGRWAVLEAATGLIGLALEVVGCDRIKEADLYVPQEDATFEDIVGQSNPMQDIFHTISQLAPSDATVLILGESGTGKELVARAIHNQSKRTEQPFIAISCPSIPRELIEAELFGHEKGAYTGAHTARPGRIEQADGGTLFLDEIGDMDQGTQSKLLRFLQEREFQRVGGRSNIRVDVRILAATSRDLEEEVQGGRFREDLYYRLSVVPLRLPPLRDRSDDIPLLVQHYLDTFAKSEGKEIPQMTRDAMGVLRRYPWPGNVRELRNTMEYLVAMTATKTIRTSDLLPKIREGAGAAEPVTAEDGDAEDSPLREGETLDARLMGVEGKLIRQALEACEGNQSRAAKMLGLKEGTLRYRMKRYGISGEK